MLEFGVASSSSSSVRESAHGGLWRDLECSEQYLRTTVLRRPQQGVNGKREDTTIRDRDGYASNVLSLLTPSPSNLLSRVALSNVPAPPQRPPTPLPRQDQSTDSPSLCPFSLSFITISSFAVTSYTHFYSVHNIVGQLRFIIRGTRTRMIVQWIFGLGWTGVALGVGADMTHGGLLFGFGFVPHSW
ncbi:hypothetical protein VTL71DRAFT_12889 [Oculimacula yallundae]|uniref:Uncharacterized protein n=1 Tax=Oculimacula yallundae TaxID=86028 RepID=A0ABR4CP96_9HELO